MDSGRLDEEPTPVVCRRLGVESRTGCLHLLGEDPADEVRIYLWEGRVYTATASTGRARLGDRLIGGGHISAEALERALQVQGTQPGPLRLGDVLVQQGSLTRDVLREVIRDQMCDAFAAGLARTSGAWHFIDGEQVPEDVPLGLGMEDALLEASRRLGQLELVRAHLGSLEAVVDFRPGSTDVRISLTADEWAMLTHIDGHATVAEVAERSGYSQLETARIIFGLLSAGVLQVVRGGPGVQAWEEPSPPPGDHHASLLGELDALHRTPQAPLPPPPVPPPPPRRDTPEMR